MKAPDRDGRSGRCVRFLRSLVFVALVFLAPPSPAADLEMTGFKLVQGSGPRRWEIRSDSASYDGENRVLLGGIDARILVPEGDGFAVTGRKGEYRSDQGILTIHEEVLARTGAGYTFSAPTVRWLGKESLVRASGGVDLAAAGVDVKGETMTYHINRRVAEVTGPVRAVWSFDQEGP